MLFFSWFFVSVHVGTDVTAPPRATTLMPTSLSLDGPRDARCFDRAYGRADLCRSTTSLIKSKDRSAFGWMACSP